MPTRPLTHSQRRRLAAGQPIDQRSPDRRGSASSRGYDHSWRKLRDAHLAENPLCVICHRAADLVDHVTPINAGGATLDPANLRSLCRRHHDQITAHYRRTGINELPKLAGGFAVIRQEHRP